jgi:hypothetical protein
VISLLDLLPEARAAAGNAAARDTTPYTVGFLHEISADGKRALVSVRDSQPISLPCAPSTYTGVSTVHVLVDPATGRPLHVLAPGEFVAEGDAPQPPPPPEPEQAPARKVTGKVIKPTWTGTYRVNRAAWDRWNTSSYGGRSDLWQGSSASSGQLYGLAVYGDQVRNLNAVSIDRIRVTLVNNGGGHYFTNPAYTLRGTPAGTKPAGAPSFTSGTATSPRTTRHGTTSVDLPDAMRDEFRTGTLRGLGVIGTDYAGLRGTGHAAGMALVVDYTVAD